MLIKNKLTKERSRVNRSDYTKPTEKILRKNLTQTEYAVTQEEGTEPPFQNKYWDFQGEGIYVDIVSGEPLFSSLEKFDSGCGWPSFAKPLPQTKLTEKIDNKKLMRTRTEVRSDGADSHLGHVFDDGPKELGGLRYCINSAAIRFVPVDDLENQGYHDYLAIFQK